MASPQPPNRSVIDRNARLGLILFFIYLALYGGFMALTVCAVERMQQPVTWLGGINLAVAYGMGLILAAFVLAMVYMVLCKRVNESGQEGLQ